MAAAETVSVLSSDGYVTILDEATFADWLKNCKAPTCLLLTETDSLDTLSANIVGIAFAVAPGEALPVAHDYLDAPPQLDRAAVLKQLKPLLEDSKAAKVGQNLKYDRGVLKITILS